MTLHVPKTNATHPSGATSRPIHAMTTMSVQPTPVFRVLVVRTLPKHATMEIPARTITAIQVQETASSRARPAMTEMLVPTTAAKSVATQPPA